MKCKILILVALLVASMGMASAATLDSPTLKMTSCLENSNPELQFNYAENIGDGRGITFGCIGFCTGTYDGNVLVKHYTTLNPNNPLAKYIPALNAIDAGSHNAAGGDGNPSVAGLDGFITDVKNNKDPLFKQAQLDKLYSLYYAPAMKLSDSVGAKNKLTRAFIYDMCVRHGVDGAQSIIKKAGTTPAQGANENAYLEKLISVRDGYLKDEGLGDVDRDTGYKMLLASGNVNLKTPYTFYAYGDKFTITGDTVITTPSAGNSTDINKTVTNKTCVPPVIKKDKHIHKDNHKNKHHRHYKISKCTRR